MSQDPKLLHSFIVQVATDVDKTETREENGQTITTTTKVKELVPVHFGFRKPSRAEREDAELYRVNQWSEYVKKGVLPHALLIKQYANGGGTFNDFEREEYQKHQKAYFERSQEYQLAVVQKEEEKAKTLLSEILKTREKILELERSHVDFFENTAEAKAKIRMTEYLLLHLALWKVGDKWEPYFKGDSLAAKIDHLDQLEETSDRTFALARSELTTIASIAALFIMSRDLLTKENIDKFVREIAGDGKLPG